MESVYRPSNPFEAVCDSSVVCTPRIRDIISAFQQERRVQLTPSQVDLCARCFLRFNGSSFECSVLVNMGTGRGKTLVLMFAIWLQRRACAMDSSIKPMRVLFFCDAIRLNEVCSELRYYGLRTYGIGEFGRTRNDILTHFDTIRLIEEIEVLVVPFTQFSQLTMCDMVFHPDRHHFNGGDRDCQAKMRDHVLCDTMDPEGKGRKSLESTNSSTVHKFEAHRLRKILEAIECDRMPLDRFRPESGQITREEYFLVLEAMLPTFCKLNSCLVASFQPTLICSEELVVSKNCRAYARAANDACGIPTIAVTATKNVSGGSRFAFMDLIEARAADEFDLPEIEHTGHASRQRNFYVRWDTPVASSAEVADLLANVWFSWGGNGTNISALKRTEVGTYVYRVTGYADESKTKKLAQAHKDLLEDTFSVFGLKQVSHQTYDDQLHGPQVKMQIQPHWTPFEQDVFLWVEGGYRGEGPFVDAYERQVHSVCRSVIDEADRRGVVGFAVVGAGRNDYKCPPALSKLLKSPLLSPSSGISPGVRDLYACVAGAQRILDPMDLASAADYMETLPFVLRLLLTTNINQIIARYVFCSGRREDGTLSKIRYTSRTKQSSVRIENWIKDSRGDDSWVHAKDARMPVGMSLLHVDNRLRIAVVDGPNKEMEKRADNALAYLRSEGPKGYETPTVVLLSEAMMQGTNLLSRNRLSIVLAIDLRSPSEYQHRDLAQWVGRINRIRSVQSNEDTLGVRIVPLWSPYISTEATKVLTRALAKSLRTYAFKEKTLIVETDTVHSLSSQALVHRKFPQTLGNDQATAEVSQTQWISVDEMTGERTVIPAEQPAEDDEVLTECLGQGPWSENWEVDRWKYVDRDRYRRAQGKATDAILRANIEWKNFYFEPDTVDGACGEVGAEAEDDCCPPPSARSEEALAWIKGIMQPRNYRQQVEALDHCLWRMERRVLEFKRQPQLGKELVAEHRKRRREAAAELREQKRAKALEDAMRAEAFS